jgi:hypothetical protein
MQDLEEQKVNEILQNIGLSSIKEAQQVPEQYGQQQ